MHLNRLLLGAWLAATALCAVARAEEPITNTLTAQRVVVADGVEHFESAATGQPGDVIEYRILIRNAGATAAHGLEATLPIPGGMVLIPTSIPASGVRGSVDGSTFAPLPLRHRVVQPDGTSVEELVPTAAIRYVRFAPADVPPKGSLSVSARVMLAGNEPTTHGPTTQAKELE